MGSLYHIYDDCIPSYGEAATNAEESEYPELWRGLVGAWVPALGNTGANLPGIVFGNSAALQGSASWSVSCAGPGILLDAAGEFLSFSARNLVDLNASARWTALLWMVVGSLNTYSGHLVFNGSGLVETKNQKWGAVQDSGNGSIDVTACSASSKVAGELVHLAVTCSAPYAVPNTGVHLYRNGILNDGTWGSDTGYGLAGRYDIGRGYGGLIGYGTYLLSAIYDYPLPSLLVGQSAADPYAPFRLRRRVYAVAVAEAAPPVTAAFPWWLYQPQEVY